MGADKPSGTGRPKDPYELAREICLRQLAHSARTRSQLADAMRRRAVPDEVAADVLSRFEDVGLIDDRVFAAAWVDSRHRARGVGPRKIAYELRNRGVSPDLISATVETITTDEQRATARRLVERRLASTRGQPAPLRARRLVGMLARKGYSPVIAHDVVRAALAVDGEELPDVIELLPDEL